MAMQYKISEIRNDKITFVGSLARVIITVYVSHHLEQISSSLEFDIILPCDKSVSIEQLRQSAYEEAKKMMGLFIEHAGQAPLTDLISEFGSDSPEE